jgi:prevent-host-death family protein
MNRTISQRDLRNDSAAVLRQVEAGETLVITRNGTPVAELRPLGPRRYVPRDRLVAAGRTAPRIDLVRFRADLDGVVDPTLDD